MKNKGYSLWESNLREVRFPKLAESYNMMKIQTPPQQLPFWLRNSAARIGILTSNKYSRQILESDVLGQLWALKTHRKSL